MKNLNQQNEVDQRNTLNARETKKSDFIFDDIYLDDTLQLQEGQGFPNGQKEGMNGTENNNRKQLSDVETQRDIKHNIKLENYQSKEKPKNETVFHGGKHDNEILSPKPIKKGTKMCNFYNNPINPCRNGNNCNYQHIKRKQNICLYHLQGNCWYKQYCWNFHPKNIHRWREKKEKKRKREIVETKRGKINLILEMKKIKDQIKNMNKILCFILNKGDQKTTDISTVPADGEIKVEKENESGEARKIDGNVYQCLLTDEENENKLTEDAMVTEEFGQEINKIKDIKVQETNDYKKEQEQFKIGQRKGHPVRETNVENYVQELPEIEQTTVDQKDAYSVYIDWITRGYWEKNAKDIDERAEDKDYERTKSNNDAKIIKCSNDEKENGKNYKSSEGPKMNKEQNFWNGLKLNYSAKYGESMKKI